MNEIMKKSSELNQDTNSIDELFQRSLRFRDTYEFFSFFKFIGKVLHYSHYNAMLVYWQNKDVKYFGTPGYWKNKFGRTVKENARPYVIIVPFGPAALAYDLYETEGEESPEEFINRGLRGGIFKINGNLPEVLLKEIIQNLAEYNISVEFKYFRFNKGGETYDYSDNSVKIFVSSEFSPEQAFATLIHELAHNFLGHLGEKYLIKKSHKIDEKKEGEKLEKIHIKARNVSSSIREIEAEVVSYIVCSRWNLEKDPLEYISWHISQENLSKISVEKIIKVADKVENTFLEKFKPQV